MSTKTDFVWVSGISGNCFIKVEEESCICVWSDGNKKVNGRYRSRFLLENAYKTGTFSVFFPAEALI